MSQRRTTTVGGTAIGGVIRALRSYRGLSLEETARLVGVSAPNLSRTERGLPGGVHPRHLERVATVLGTSVSSLHVLAEVVADRPKLLEHPDKLAELTDRLTHIQRAYLRVSARQREKVDRLLGV